LISPGIEIINFHHLVRTNNDLWVYIFFKNPCERIIFLNVEAECCSHTESIWFSYIFFHKFRLCMSNLLRVPTSNAHHI